MQAHLPAATPLIAPYVNSYRRYVKDHAAPVNLEWAHDNRTTAIRVPISNPGARRVENRVAGMDCNPYLGIAASLACGYLGLVEDRKPTPEHKGDAYASAQAIPRGLFDALGRFHDAHKLRTILGEEFAKAYEHVKAGEYEEFLQEISPWEREYLLLNV